jgi:uncharacterized repeat protein (TIGR01451 family)
MHSRSRGFSILEALIALVVLATGLLAVARFQSGLVTNSGSSKARAEAIALAQQKIDDIRSYKDEPELVANLLNVAYDASKNFDDDVATATVTEAGTIQGINTDFTRAWTITKAATDPTAIVDVTVTWSDPSSGADASGNAFTEQVMLSTEVTWANPTLGGALGLLDPNPLVPQSTGRARLGEGHYDDLDALDQDRLKDNEDGTLTYENISTGEVELIDSVTGDVLITLEEACNTTSGGLTVCTDFVRISGLVWIHRGSGVSITTSNLFVEASDAAVCAEQKGTGQIQTVGTGTSEYQYYPYTCYLGGGYHGNIGVTQAPGPGKKAGNVCVGDPLSSTINKPVVANRRVYRGMLSRDQYTGQGTTPPVDLIVDDIDSDNIGEYDSIGVTDALELPNQYDTAINTDYNNGYGDASGNLYLPGHNYMISDLGNDPEDADCLAPMTDTAVLLTLTSATTTPSPKTVNAFVGTEDDFVCLNQLYPYASTDASGNAITAQQPFYDVIDFRIDTDTNRLDVDSGHIDANDVQYRLKTVFSDASANFVYAVDTSVAAVTDASGNVLYPDKSNNIVNNNANIEQKHFVDSGGCPFSPADPPSELDFLYGSLYFTDGTASIVSGMVVNTSDDIALGTVGNCTVRTRAAVGSATRGDGTTDAAPDQYGDASPTTAVMADYECKIYHSYDVATSTGNGWEGIVTIVPANNYGCSAATDSSTESYTYTDAAPIIQNTGDQTGTAGVLDYNCSYIGPTGADLVVAHTLTSGDSTPLDTDTVTFQTTITNNGLADATGISLTNTIPSGLTYVAASGSTSITTGTAGASTTAGTWDSTTGLWTGVNLLDGDQATLTWNATISGSVGDEIISTVTGFTSDQTDSNTTPDDLEESIIVTSTGTANLVYIKTLTSGNSNPGQGEAITYDVTVTNLGGGSAGSVTLRDPVPTGLTNWVTTPGNTSISDASTNYAGDLWSIGTLLNGESASLTIDATVTNSASGTITNKITEKDTAPTLPDPSDINDVLEVAVSVTSGKVADLVTTITVDDATPVVGDTITFTITVLNTASSPDTAAGVSVTIDDLKTSGGAAGFTVGYNSGGNPTVGSYNSLTGVWDNTSSTFNLAPGASATLTLTAEVTAANTTTINTTYATALGTPATTDPNPTGDGDIDVEIVASAASGSTVTIAGAINYSADTAVDVTSVAIYSVDAAATTPGTAGVCTLNAGDASAGTDGSYTCTVTIDPADSDGVYLDFGFSKTICNNNARISSGTLVTTGSNELYWLNNTTLGSIAVGSVNIDAYDEGGSNANCPP